MGDHIYCKCLKNALKLGCAKRALNGKVFSVLNR